MRIITNLDQGANIQIPLYELFIIEIAYNPTIGEHLSDPSFQNIKNCEVLKEIYVNGNAELIGSDGKMIYLMMAIKPVPSMLCWFFSGPNYQCEFNFKLTVLPHN